MSNGKWFNNIARVIKYVKNDKKNYMLVFERPKDKQGKYIGDSPFPLTINEGDILQAKLKSAELNRLVELNKISADTAAEIGERVKFEFSIPPAREGNEKKSAKKSEPSETEDREF